MKNLIAENIKSFRYEQKYYLENMRRDETETMLKFHPAIFSEIHQERRVNNIYFDSLEWKSYVDNVRGINQRLKVRIRWYGELFGKIKSPVLELKFKNNFHVGKLSRPLGEFDLGNRFTAQTVRDVLEKSSLSRTLKMYVSSLNLSLLNTYRRKYFLSCDKKYRITVDDALDTYKLNPQHNSFLHASKDAKASIMEIKYNASNSSSVKDLTQHFPFRLTKSSKYEKGFRRIYG